jgi:hypothetical protein
MSIALNTLPVEDIIILVSVFFAVVLGFSHGINAAKGR